MEKKKNYNLLIGVIVLLLIVFVVALVGYIVSKPKPIVIQGEAEATEYRVSGKVPGRVEEFYANEGDTVHKGDTLVLIDSPEVRAKLNQARSVRDAAMAQRAKALKGARQEEIAGAYEIYQKALVGEEIMKKSFNRVKNLFDKGVISAQKYDEAEAQYKAAVATAAAAKSQYDMAVSGARNEDKAAAIALVNQANGAVEEVESYLGELKLTSPADGVISARYPKVGELVGQGSPIFTVTDLGDMWFTFAIREDLFQALKTGDEVEIRIPALNTTCKGKITFISVMQSYATWKATKSSDQFDTKTFEVRAVPTAPVDGLRPGMSGILIERQ